MSLFFFSFFSVNMARMGWAVALVYVATASAFAPTRLMAMRPTSMRFDTRQYGLFENRAASSLSNSTDSHNNTPLNGHRPSYINGDNTSAAVLDQQPAVNGKNNQDPEGNLKANGEQKQVPSFREGTNNPSGIGGQGGVDYNVNALKRNLLQETVRAYKMELLALLQSPSASEHVIAEKLAALVQASAVRTTTDSNLLQAEGVHWTLCYQSKFSTVAQLRRPPPPLLRNQSKRASPPLSPAMRRVSGKKFSLTRSFQRSFYLESLSDNQEPCVVDRESYWGGLIRRERTYTIKALTRTSLNVQLKSTRRWVLGREQQQQQQQQQQKSSTSQETRSSVYPVAANLPLDMTIIYSDTDLCIIADPRQKTYQVYTQVDTWEGAQLTRQLRFLLANFWYRLTHLGTGGAAASSRRLERSNARLLQELQHHQDLLDEESRLIVWQLGAGDDDEEAWESRKDPFVHLSADDRQRILKAMSVRQVRQAGQNYATTQKRARFLRFPWFSKSRRTHFTSPELERQRKTDKFRRPEP